MINLKEKKGVLVFVFLLILSLIIAVVVAVLEVWNNNEHNAWHDANNIRVSGVCGGITSLQNWVQNKDVQSISCPFVPWETSKKVWHDARDVRITINGASYDLQNYINIKIAESAATAPGPLQIWDESGHLTWHDANDIKVNVEGTDYSLQEWIDSEPEATEPEEPPGDGGGGGGVVPPGGGEPSVVICEGSSCCVEGTESECVGCGLFGPLFCDPAETWTGSKCCLNNVVCVEGTESGCGHVIDLSSDSIKEHWTGRKCCVDSCAIATTTTTTSSWSTGLSHPYTHPTYGSLYDYTPSWYPVGHLPGSSTYGYSTRSATFTSQKSSTCEPVACTEGKEERCGTDDVGEWLLGSYVDEDWTGSVCCASGHNGITCTEGTEADCARNIWNNYEDWTGEKCCVAEFTNCVEGNAEGCNEGILTNELWTGEKCCIRSFSPLTCVEGTVGGCTEGVFGDKPHWTGELCCT